MESGEIGQNGERVPFPDVEADKHGQEVATIQLLLMVAVTAQALVVIIKVVLLHAFVHFITHFKIFMYLNLSIYFIQLIRLWTLDSQKQQMLQTLGEY